MFSPSSTVPTICISQSSLVFARIPQYLQLCHQPPFTPHHLQHCIFPSPPPPSNFPTFYNYFTMSPFLISNIRFLFIFFPQNFYVVLFPILKIKIKEEKTQFSYLFWLFIPNLFKIWGLNNSLNFFDCFFIEFKSSFSSLFPLLRIHLTLYNYLMANYWVLCSKSNTKKERGTIIENVGVPWKREGHENIFWLGFVFIHCGVKRKSTSQQNVCFWRKWLQNYAPPPFKKHASRYHELW